MDGRDDESRLPLSQVANDFFNPLCRPGEGDRTDFRGLLDGFRNGAGAGPGPASEAEQAVAAVAASRPRPRKQAKLFNDPIHGSFRLSPACTEVIDTRQFQRLRRLKQLGLTYQVFPGASHNRFEHSLGVAHLAYKWGDHLQRLMLSEARQVQNEEHRRDLRVVELAGLCHDLGHGPFSHVFEKEFLSRKGITDWEHERMSADMLEFLVDDNAIDCIPEEDLARVKAMITAGHAGGAPPPRGQQWLYEVVANGRSGIDVDKFDYLLRDSAYCGVRIAADPNRIIQFSKVLNDEICFKWSEYMTLHELFHSRASMHRQVYTHKKAKAIEFMVVDALLEADPALRISQRIWKPSEFQLLDDQLLDLVENWELAAGAGRLQLEDDDDRAMRAAQAIIQRIRRRDLYKYVTDCQVPPEELERQMWTPPTAQDIVNCYSGSGGVKLRAEDIILQANKIDHGQGQRNPLDRCHFYDSLDDREGRKLRPDQITSMVVASYQEKSLRVYSRDSSPEVCRAVHQAFDSWVKARFKGRVATSTPCKPPRPPPPAAAQAAAEAAAAAGGLGKRGRDMFKPRAAGAAVSSAGGGGGSDSDVSPSNLMRTKQARLGGGR